MLFSYQKYLSTFDTKIMPSVPMFPKLVVALFLAVTAVRATTAEGQTGVSVPPLRLNAAIDRHPELKSRPVAWTEYDGSYLVDTSSRAEMLDFYWNVFAKPYPATGWTGSFTPWVAGQISEQRRVREYAQLNAYRALNASPIFSEDPTWIDRVQYAALVEGASPTGISHHIDSTWKGYTPEVADTAANSLLCGYLDYASAQTAQLRGIVDAFIIDGGAVNAAAVGHRANLLHDATVTGAVGAASDLNFINSGLGDGVAVFHTTLVLRNELKGFIALPAPGYMPRGLFKDVGYRWSFGLKYDTYTLRTATDNMPVKAGLAQKDATVTARINGVPVPVHNLQLGGVGMTTWDFDQSYLPLQDGKAPDGTTVEISISNIGVAPVGRAIDQYLDYTYTVTFFDENSIVPVAYAPKTPLTNISTRTVIGGGDQQMIAGFSVDGTLPVRIALRTQGPGLTRYGVTNAAKTTRLRVYDSNGVLMGENTSWKSHPNWRLLQSLGVNPTNEAEAGMVLTLWPGLYTAVVNDDTGSGGVGIVEAFNIDNQSATPITNLSTRGVVGQGEGQMIAGFALQGGARTLVVRTQGPGLAKYGVANTAADTELKIVRQSDGQVVATNDDWATGPTNARLSGDLKAYAPTDSREAALVLTLPPGTYTALVNAKSGPGVGIVEVFDVSP
jgi:hypothetical protein